MDQLFTAIHPNPGWEELNNPKSMKKEKSNNTEIVGKHCILELYDCDKSKLNDEAFIRTNITSAAKSAGATLINLISHHFEPQGVTGLALLAESHISIHTWPENGYAAIDIFTCGDHTMPEKACQFLYNALLAKEFSLTNLNRKTTVSITHSLTDISSEREQIKP